VIKFLKTFAVRAPGRRPRHDQQYQEVDASQCEGEIALQLFEDWLDPIETAVRERARESLKIDPQGVRAAVAGHRYAPPFPPLAER
jgi:hypothetical protein